MYVQKTNLIRECYNFEVNFNNIFLPVKQKPSVLAKIFGFYTIKIKDTKKNNNIIKMDVLVMEHLFFGKTITSVSIMTFKV